MPAHTAKHICNSHKPTHKQKLQKSLSVCHPIFADPKNYFFSGTAVLRLNGFMIAKG